MKTIVVTGSNKGIGYEIVRKLKHSFGNHARVVLCSRDKLRGEEAVSLLVREGLDVDLGILDIASKESIDSFVEFLGPYGGVDILVNNAGFAFKNKATEPFGEQARTTIDINYYGTLHLSHALLPLMKPDGRIVNVSSMAGKLKILSEARQQQFAAPDLTEDQLTTLMEEFVALAEKGTHTDHGFPNTAYGMSKVGVSALTRIMARDHPQLKINACCPGWCRTDMAGSSASKSAEQGAETPFLLCTGDQIQTGQFWSEQQIAPW